VALDEIQDPHNLGAIIRCCAATGVSSVLLTEKNTAKVNHTVIKTSSGATNHVSISLVKNIYEAIHELKSLSFNIVGTSLNADVSHFDYRFNSKTVLLLGNEGLGLRKNIIKLCDNIIRIPILSKRIDSLNVSVAAGVILYEIIRQAKK
jgi:23S rRNA (guanosine2251-2'-O)-methyltransferase